MRVHARQCSSTAAPPLQSCCSSDRAALLSPTCLAAFAAAAARSASTFRRSLLEMGLRGCSLPSRSLLRPLLLLRRRSPHPSLREPLSLLLLRLLRRRSRA